jgi:hypothetical protein
MYLTFNRLLALGVALFLAVSLGLWAREALYVWPRKACEARGDWWDPHDRVCAVPISVTKFTGRPIGAPPLKTAH